MKERLAKLVDIKSMVTLFLTLVFCYLSIASDVSEQFMMVYTTVIAFYFGTQTAKKTE